MYNLLIINDDEDNSQYHLAFTICQVFVLYFLCVAHFLKILKTALCMRERRGGRSTDVHWESLGEPCFRGVSPEEGIGNHSMSAAAGSPGRRLPTLPVNQPCPG